MKEIAVLLPHSLSAKDMLEFLANPEKLPDDVYIDMQDGTFETIRDFFQHCKDALRESFEEDKKAPAN